MAALEDLFNELDARHLRAATTEVLETTTGLLGRIEHAAPVNAAVAAGNHLATGAALDRRVAIGARGVDAHHDETADFVDGYRDIVADIYHGHLDVVVDIVVAVVILRATVMRRRYGHRGWSCRRVVVAS